MLSPPDADLVRRDLSLRGLSTLLDPEAFAAALRPFLPGAFQGEAECVYVRYKPGMNCLAAYRLFVEGKPLGVYARTFGSDAAVKMDKRREKKTVSGPLCPGRIVLEGDAAIVCAFPNDDELGSLLELADPEAWKARLRALLPDHPGLWEGELRTLAYKPERRYVARLGTSDGSGAVLKFYSENGYLPALRNAKAFRSRGTLRIARRIGKSDRRRILAFEWLPGRLLSEAISDPRPEPGAVAAAGRALAELHAQDPEGLATLSRKEEAGRLTALAAGVGFLRPRAAERAESLARRIAGALMEAPPSRRAVHGDFYANQVLIDGERAALLDLDRAASGDPAADLGRFIAHLERDALRGKIPPALVRPARDGFLAGYREAAPLPLPARIALHAAAGLFGLSMDPFRLREADWPDRIEALLGRAEAIVETECRTIPLFPSHPAPMEPIEGG